MAQERLQQALVRLVAVVQIAPLLIEGISRNRMRTGSAICR